MAFHINLLEICAKQNLVTNSSALNIVEMWTNNIYAQKPPKKVYEQFMDSLHRFEYLSARIDNVDLDLQQPIKSKYPLFSSPNLYLNLTLLKESFALLVHPFHQMTKIFYFYLRMEISVQSDSTRRRWKERSYSRITLCQPYKNRKAMQMMSLVAVRAILLVKTEAGMKGAT